MSRRVYIFKWIISNIPIPVPRRGVPRAGHDGIRLDEVGDVRVIPLRSLTLASGRLRATISRHSSAIQSPLPRAAAACAPNGVWRCSPSGGHRGRRPPGPNPCGAKPSTPAGAAGRSETRLPKSGVSGILCKWHSSFRPPVFKTDGQLI